MNQLSLQALGTTWWIEIFGNEDEKTLDSTFGAIERFIRTFEDTYSRFKPDSQISILNRERVLHNPSEECRTLLMYGKSLYLRSHQTFNLLSAHLQEARGYDTDYSFVAKEGSEEKMTCSPIIDLTIDTDTITLTCGSVDPGGFGKGYLVDLVAEELKKMGFEYFLINGGGDMYGTSDVGAPIEVYLEHPTEPGQYIASTHIYNQGFAASSPFKRQWRTKDKTYSHIISNTEVLPLASFVKGATARDADSFGTISLMLDEPTLLEIARAEQLEFARYNPVTNQLWQTLNFNGA
jgi:FAD:protein FMN transferase